MTESVTLTGYFCLKLDFDYQFHYLGVPRLLSLKAKRGGLFITIFCSKKEQKDFHCNP
jgi:hypothetical protein